MSDQQRQKRWDRRYIELARTVALEEVWGDQSQENEMRKSNDNTVEIDATIECETDKAYLLDVGEPDKVWMPKSQVRDVQRGSGRLVKMTVTEWIANEKGLI